MSNTMIKCDVKCSFLKNKKQCQRRKAERETQKKEEERRTMKIRQQRTKEGGEAIRRRKLQEGGKKGRRTGRYSRRYTKFTKTRIDKNPVQQKLHNIKKQDMK